MVNKLIALASEHPMTSGLVIIVTLTAASVVAALVHDHLEQRRLTELHAKLLALEAERDRLKGQL